MAEFGKRSSSKSWSVALLACYLVILLGMAFSVTIIMVAAPKSDYNLPIVVGIFGLISLYPVYSVFWTKNPMDRLKQKETLWAWLKDRFAGRQRASARLPKSWKRKKTDFVSQPHGTDYHTTFTPTHKEPPPAKGR